jgi:hypothetical protein
MKRSSTRIAGIIALVGGVWSLIGFCLLPFSADPRAGDFRSGPGVLWDYEVLLSAPHPYSPMVPDPTLVSTYALWALFILFALLTCFSFPPILKQTPGRVLPLLQVVLGMVAVVCLFLAVYRWTSSSSSSIDSRNDLQILIENAFRFVASGWWISAIGVSLTLVASLGMFLMSFPKRTTASKAA